MSNWKATYGDTLKSKRTGRLYEVIDWLNDDGGTEYTLRDILNDKLVSMTGDMLVKHVEDKRLLLSQEELNKIKAEAVESYHSFLLTAVIPQYQEAINEVKNEYLKRLEKGEK